MTTLRQLHSAQTGKVSDKWSLYLAEYERLLEPYRTLPVRLLEIGVQNGGSLQVWSEYFAAAEQLVGCDIEPACADLRYDDPRIAVVVGDANLDATEERILAHSDTFDIIVDDGSHRSTDIIASFGGYFPHLRDGGIYVVEDLHCSYWHEFGGGLHDPLSAVSFFKVLADILSHEHWVRPAPRCESLRRFAERHRVSFDEETLRHVHSVELVNSMCVIRKAAPAANVLGLRQVVGTEASVCARVQKMDVEAPPMPEIMTDSSVDALLQIADLKAQVETLRAQAARTAVERDRMHVELDAKSAKLSQMDFDRAQQQGRIDHLTHELFLVTVSTSWKVTQPLRGGSRLAMKSLHRLGREVYNRLPEPYRTPVVNWSYRNLGPVMNGLPEYERWARGGAAAIPYVGESMIDLENVPAATRANGSIAIQLHVYYHDLVDEFARHLSNMPFPYDLFVSVASDEGEQACRTAFGALAMCSALEIVRVENLGRDLLPVFCTFGKKLAGYDYIAHMHSKKSLFNGGATMGWREYLLHGLLGSDKDIRKIFALMQGTDPCGIVYPQNSSLLPYWANTWLGTRDLGSTWCARLGIQQPRGYFDFPVGSMFWARGDALRPLFEAGITVSDFAPEAGQMDGTIAHCLERLFALTARKQGFRVGIVRDRERKSWSPWRIDQYTDRPRQAVFEQLSAPDIRVIAFDIFDTLLTRPLLDPEAIKGIVAERVGGPIGRLFLEHRALAEAEARQSAGHDIGLDAIYARLGARARIDASTLAMLRKHEEDAERASLRPRPEAVELFNHAVGTGKLVVLISDMFLPRTVIEGCLREHGIDGWQRFFLSNEVGLRKDTAALYQYLLEEYQVKPQQVVVLGDNERSDLQIPSDRGFRHVHLMRPLELARSLPRTNRIVERHTAGDVHDELTLGLVLQRSFSAVHQQDRLDPLSLFEPTPFDLGYNLVGPMLVSFAEWLRVNAAKDGVTKLYFVAREGKLIKRVYDSWTTGLSDAPSTEYLVISRRAVSVPALRTLGDILRVAGAVFFPNTIESFLEARYGLTLSGERWRQLPWDRTRKLEIRDGNIEVLVPLLEALQPDILAAADRERESLMRYLDSLGLTEPGRHSVVDVGYGGTTQDYLNRLLSSPVDGYYLMTDDRAAKVAEAHGVALRGCFLDGQVQNQGSSLMYRHSFELEKMLSSDDAQVVRYELDASGKPIGHHYELSDDERAHAEGRERLQDGALAYVRDARAVRADLLPSFRPSCAVAESLYGGFVTGLSPRETNVLKAIVLDDHYCGRGLVR